MIMNSSTIYGPVRSWRFGQSLGVDLILTNSVCSFDCVYCQLGPIQERTLKRREFVPIERLIGDLEAHGWAGAEVVTFSGSGEPTLATNIGEAIEAIAARTRLPTIVLTNGTLLGDAAVREALMAADRVEVKLDAADEATFQRANRPVGGVTLEGIVGGAATFRRHYRGHLSLQVMVLPMNRNDLEGLAAWVRQIAPDSLCLNSPRRPRPSQWYLPSRGSHDGVSYPAQPLRQPSAEECRRLAQRIADGTDVEIWLDAGERSIVKPARVKAG